MGLMIGVRATRWVHIKIQNTKQNKTKNNLKMNEVNKMN